MTHIKGLSDITINNKQDIINIVNNISLGWKTSKYDITKNTAKCKYFSDSRYDYISNFTNSQKESVKDRIKDNLFKYRGNDNAITLTYIISDRGVKYGQIINGLEFGTSHLHLIDDSEEKVLVGGELSVNFITNEVRYNLLSGTFTLTIIKLLEDPNEKTNYENKLKLLIEKVLNIKDKETDPTLKIEFTEDGLLPSTKPDVEELRNICKLNS